MVFTFAYCTALLDSFEEKCDRKGRERESERGDNMQQRDKVGFEPMPLRGTPGTYSHEVAVHFGHIH